MKRKLGDVTLSHFFELDPDSLAQKLVSWGLPAYRSGQIMQWVYRHGATRFEDMANLPAPARRTLAQHLSLAQGHVLRHLDATDGTRKLLLGWDPPQASTPTASLRVLQPDDYPPNSTECVMIPAQSKDSGKLRRTACVSSQVGCPVGCRFCASGMDGLERNLTAGQIVEQVWRLHHLDRHTADPPQIGPRPSPITNVVFMGMGEPMVNFIAVARALHLLTSEWGLNLSARKITVSTVGVPAGIRKLAELGLPVTLAVSLHAPNDELRRKIIPWASFVSIADLIEAGRNYFNKTGREVTLEYILLSGVNDQPDHARELAVVSRRLRSNINLIRFNEVPGLPFERPATDDVRRFQSILQDAGRTVHIRASRGRDIAAACGQLRRSSVAAPPDLKTEVGIGDRVS